MKTYLALVLFFVAVAGLIGASKLWQKVAPPEMTFTQECLADGNMWHSMTPLRNGIELPGDEQPGCMTANGLHHFAEAAEYRAAKNPGESDATMDTEQIGEGLLYRLRFSLTDTDGVPELYREHDRYLHVVIISRDMRHFAHVHPEDQEGFNASSITRGVFDLEHEFPAPGEYIVAIDYANKLKHESRQFHVTVPGETTGNTALYESPQTVGGYTVSLDHALALAGENTALRFTVEKNGAPVTDLRPYLAAAMHVAVVKNDLAEFIHAHGEIHPPGYVPPATQQTTHIHTPPPQKFGPNVEAHVTFSTSGEYTVFAEFADASGTIVRAPFTIAVQ